MASNYTEASIKTLSSLEHIRLRPGMYIGRLGNGAHADDGIYVLLKETIDNSIDEFMMGQGRKIEVEITDRSVSRQELEAAIEAEEGHVHGPGCGHEAVPHGDHTDYLVEGRLHHMHDGHCDDHGPLAIAA